MALSFRLCSNVYRCTELKVILTSIECSAILPYRGIKRFVVPVKKMMLKRKREMDPQPPQPRNTFIEWNYNAELFAFGKRLGEEFKKDYLQQAFVDRSYIIMEEEKQKKVGIEEPDISLKDNSEFVRLGELLISKYAKRYLRTVFPRFPEEGICSVSDYLLSDEVLADISKNIGTSDIILLSEHPPSTTTLANVLKAIVHALELSSGENRATLFVRDFIITYLSGKDINELWNIKDPEKVLASILERDGRSKQEPRLIAEAGKSTILAAYQVGLYSEKEFIGIGFGESIKVAKEIAAMDALKRMFHTTERANPIPFNLMLPSGKNDPFANLSIQDWCEKSVEMILNNNR